MASYPYAAGVIRSLENKLLNKTDIERILNAPNLSSAFKVFHDTEYADNLSDVKPHEFKKALDQDWRQTRFYLISLISDKENIKQFLFLKNDFRNIKLFFKNKLAFEDLTSHQKNFGTIDSNILYKYIVENDKTVNIPDMFQTVINNALEYIDSANNIPHEIDSYFDEVYFKLMRRIVNDIDNKFITELFRIQHKTNNLKFFIRAKRFNKTINQVKNGLPERYHSLYNLSIEEAMRNLYWPYEMQPAIENYLNEPTLWKLEKDLEEAEINYLKKAKLISYGPELIVAYYFAKRNAHRNVRLIMTGKMNNVDPIKIKERIRILY